MAAPDKFYGTSTATAAADAIARGAARAGWEALRVPMSDGGEGFCEVLGGELREATVHGPLGGLVRARWSMLDDSTAVVESAQAAGRSLVPDPAGDDPVRADTYGVGELLAAALEDRPRRVLVGCGGTASTDGGRGCVRALDDLGTVIDVELVAACDVSIPFREAASAFGPQKGATAAQVAALLERLDADADYYRDRFGVDVARNRGAGAAGGLAGGLFALGAKLVNGAGLVAERLGLDRALGGAGLVVTGEGRLDEGTLAGKVVATVLARSEGLDALVLAGQQVDGVAARLAARRRGATVVVSLPGDVGVAEGIEAVVAARLGAPG